MFLTIQPARNGNIIELRKNPGNEPVGCTLEDIKDDYGRQLPYKIIYNEADNLPEIKHKAKKETLELAAKVYINDNTDGVNFVRLEPNGGKVFSNEPQNMITIVNKSDAHPQGVNEEMFLAVLREIIKLKSGDFVEKR